VQAALQLLALTVSVRLFLPDIPLVVAVLGVGRAAGPGRGTFHQEFPSLVSS